MRIGIYGGTFNPIHNGHIGIIKGFIDKLELDKILIIPTAVPPHKQTSMLANAFDRIEMCKIALKDVKQAEVCDVEIKRGGKSYTADTVQFIADENPDAKIFLLMGEDMFLTLQNWYMPEKIFAVSAIAVAPRSLEINKIAQHKAFLEDKFSAKIYLLDIPYIEISSTDIRNFYAGGKTSSEFMPKKVEDYIISRHIYMGEGI